MNTRTLVQRGKEDLANRPCATGHNHSAKQRTFERFVQWQTFKNSLALRLAFSALSSLLGTLHRFAHLLLFLSQSQKLHPSCTVSVALQGQFSETCGDQQRNHFRFCESKTRCWWKQQQKKMGHLMWLHATLEPQKHCSTSQ